MFLRHHQLVAAFFLVVVATVIVATVAAGPVHANVLGFGLSSDPPTLDPHLAGGTTARTVKAVVYEGLMSFTPDADVRPQLAESVEMLDDKTYVFKLRRGVRFHQGQLLTADDVRYSFERILDRSTGAQLGATLAIIDSIETPDDYTVIIRLKEPFAPFLEVLAQPEASIVSREWMQGNPDLNRTMNGTGPFQMDFRISGVQIQMSRNPHYYEEGLPKLEGITFAIYADPDARLAALQTNQIQVMEYVEWRQIPVIQADPSLVIDLEPSIFQILVFNVKEGPFSDPRVRRAISYALNREEIAIACFEGYAVPLYGGLIPKSSWAYNEDLAHYFSYDPEKAKQLLAEAGYPNGFSATVLATSAYSTHYCPAEVAQAQLAKVGIDVRVQLVDWPTRVASRSEWNYEFASDGLSGDYLDPDFYYRFFHSSSPRYAKAPFFEDEQLDALLDEGRRTVDREKRKQIYRAVEERLLELSPWVFLVEREQPYAYRAEVKGFKQLPSFLTVFSGIMLKYTDLSR